MVLNSSLLYLWYSKKKKKKKTGRTKIRTRSFRFVVSHTCRTRSIKFTECTLYRRFILDYPYLLVLISLHLLLPRQGSSNTYGSFHHQLNCLTCIGHHVLRLNVIVEKQRQLTDLILFVHCGSEKILVWFWFGYTHNKENLARLAVPITKRSAFITHLFSP